MVLFLVLLWLAIVWLVADLQTLPTVDCLPRMKKRRKSEARSEDESDLVEHKLGNKKKAKKLRLKDGDEQEERGKEKKLSTKEIERTSSISLPTRSHDVHIDSLQSIFAAKSEADSTFTLFGDEPPSNAISPAVVPTSSIQTPTVLLPPSSQQQKKVLYFFPHYDFPEKNAQSLFPVSDEPFFYNRTEYGLCARSSLIDREEKRRIWNEGKREFTQDWKKKRKTAMKLKRRMEIRRKL
jgi:hypothetical protein